MGKKLTTLCELQLYSILQEVDNASADTSSAAHHALQSCLDLESIVAECSDGSCGRNAAMLEAVAAVKREINNIVISMQFHDELAQRVSHVLQLFTMLKNELPARLGSELDDDAEILKIATRIFSIQSEFAVLNKLFPDSFEPQNADTELF